MPGPTPPLIRGLLMLALCWCASPALGAPPVAAPAASGASALAAITHITLERDCSGCTTGLVLVLSRDGEARRVLTGKARQGTEDQRFRAAVRREDFDALARQALAAGFFGMADTHQEPGLQDGPWSQIAITRRAPGSAIGAEQVTQVFRRGDAGPPALKALEDAIDALGLRLQFAPDLR